LTGQITPARAEGLEIHEVVDGFVVYDPARDKVHYLNHTAALVLQLCDGRNDSSSISKLLQTAYALSEAPFKEVDDCLDQFTREGLVE
jgi:coenzyme PQQ synthesis protein D (PqqD)